MGSRDGLGHQPEIPGKSVTDLLAQVLLRMAGPGDDQDTGYASDEDEADRPYPPDW